MPKTKSAQSGGVTMSSPGFQGGVNVRDAINLLEPDELRRCENATLDERGGVSKRLGCADKGTFGLPADRVLSMYTFYRGITPPQLLMQTTAGKLFYTNDPTVQPIVWTEIASGFSTTEHFSYETFNNKVYFSNGIDFYSSWDGAAYLANAAAPKGRFLRLWKDTMWVSGVTGEPDRVYSSNPGDPETFGIANWIDLSKGDGDVTTALNTDGTFLIVGKRNRTFVIYDVVTFANRTVDYEKGIESHRSVIQFEGDIYFLSRRGICKWISDTPAEIISGKIDPFFDPDIINIAQLNKATAYTIGNQLGWTIPEALFDVPSFQIEYYPRLAGFTAYGNRGTGPFVTHRMPCRTFARYRSGAVDYLYAGSNKSNKVFQPFAEIGTDDGDFFTTSVETGVLDFGAPTLTKYMRRCRVLGRGKFTLIFLRNFENAIVRSQAIDLETATDTWDLLDDWGADTWGAGQSIVHEQKFHPDIYGRFFSIRVTDSEIPAGIKPVPVGSTDYALTAGEWGLYGYYIDATIAGVRD